MAASRKRFDTATKIKMGGVVLIAAGAAIVYRTRVRTLMETFGLAYDEGVDAAYENGLKYGLQLAKETALFASEASEGMASYALGTSSN